MTTESGRESFLHRPLAIVSLIAGVLGIVTAIVTLGGLFNNSDEERQAKVESCMAEHGLSTRTETQEIDSNRVFRACVWPPPFGADGDGFTEITMSSGEGPGRSEAEGLTVANVFTTECRDLELVYLFNNMGSFIAEEPIRLSKGEIRRVEGGSIWQPRTAREASIYSPGRDQSVILSNLRYTIDTARCI